MLVKRILYLLLFLPWNLAISQYAELPWRWLGPVSFPAFSGNGPCANGMGLVNAIYVYPADPSFILAGSNTGGLFRSRNAGITWENITDHHLPMVVGIGSIAADPFYPGRFYLGTGSTSFNRNYGLGIWQSNDWGSSWVPTGLQFDLQKQNARLASIRKIFVHPLKPGVIYALVRENNDGFVYRSLDGGAHWEEVLRSTDEVFFDAEFDSGDPETIYVGGKAFWKSEDGGNTWMSNRMEAPPEDDIHRIALAVHPQHPGTIWALYETGGRRGNVVAYSSDHGLSFVTRGMYSAWKLDVGAWKMEFEVSLKDTSVLYAGGVFMHRSLDGGKSFHRITNNRYPSSDWMHVDARAMQILEGAGSDVLYVGHDGGVSVSADGGDTWKDISGNGLGITQFWGFAYDPVRNRIIGGTQDLGTLIWEQGSWWNPGIYGDAYDALFHPLHTDTVVLLVHSGAPGFMRSIDGGKKWHFVSIPGKFPRNNRPLSGDYFQADLLYAGYHDVFYSRDFGLQWDRLTDFTRDFGVDPTESLISIALSPFDSNIIYVAYGEPCWSDITAKKLFRSADKGRTWKDISLNLPGVRWAGITDIAVDPYDGDEIWVSFDRFWMDDSGLKYKVFYSRDGGKHWENRSEGLPNVPVNKLTILSKHKILVAGTDAGIFFSPLNQGSWKSLGIGMPAAIISDIETNPAQTQLYAATFGRGMYIVDLPLKSRKERMKRKKKTGGFFFFQRNTPRD